MRGAMPCGCRLSRRTFAGGSSSSGRAPSTKTPALAALHEELASYPAGEPGVAPDLVAGEIAVPLRLHHGNGELAFISTVTTFGTAVDVTAAELSIEAFLPADRHTADVLGGHRLTAGTA